jgi:hypothetical protein
LLGQNLVCLAQTTRQFIPNFPTLQRMGLCGNDGRLLRLLGAVCVVK